MQITQDMDQATPHAAVVASATGAWRRTNQGAERRCDAWEFLETPHRSPASRGLAVAIPMSLSLWAMTGLLLWAMLR